MLIQGFQIGFGAGFNGISGDSATGINVPIMVQSQGHLSQSALSTGNGTNLIVFKLELLANTQGSCNGSETGCNRTIPSG